MVRVEIKLSQEDFAIGVRDETSSLDKDKSTCDLVCPVISLTLQPRTHPNCAGVCVCALPASFSSISGERTVTASSTVSE